MGLLSGKSKKAYFRRGFQKMKIFFQEHGGLEKKERGRTAPSFMLPSQDLPVLFGRVAKGWNGRNVY
jgi:hypothetical protein